MNTMSEFYRHAMGWVYRLDRHDWVMVFFGAVVIGALLLRGFGSRRYY
ncbi:MAG TPA: hypothetical protein VGJ15_09635 [Pirellulales bacterium]